MRVNYWVILGALVFCLHHDLQTWEELIPTSRICLDSRDDFLLVNKAQLVDVAIAISITTLLINFIADALTGSPIDLLQLL
jgi:hypothetical protein